MVAALLGGQRSRINAKPQEIGTGGGNDLENERRKRIELHPTNLVLTIVSALDTFTQQGLSEKITIDFQPETDDALVLANELLYHVFLNILYSALEYPLDERSITVNILRTPQGGTNWWETILQVPGRWVRQGERFRMYNSEMETYSSNSLGLMAARILTESLRGQFSIREASTTKNQIRTAFVVSLMEIESSD